MRDKELLLGIYEMMNKIRRFEEKAFILFQENALRGSVHLYSGEEAIAASVMALLRTDDYITSTHRGHGHGIAKSKDLKKAMAELMGKETGFCKGRGGSMHIADLEKGHLGASAIVGGGIPIAIGGALALKMQGTDRVCVAFFGDGASNQGTFHESLNLASVWKLPVIFVCENNGFGISVPVKQSTAVKDIAVRAIAYDMPGEAVDGNDVLAVLDAAEKAILRARRGDGPTLIECKTYRLRGHWTGDPEVYRTRQEVETWAARDPIPRLRQYLLENKMADAGRLDAIGAAAQAEVEEATAFALNSPEPDPATVMDDVFCDALEVGK
ncbi:MAG: thiamine pyrophosphate-dependent dehydrogenase E1 component subunit alpha [Planctomycetes bacterium]|nr:thiamine pyrophosphate-dependent dehydrogenase E1 component subunit alpha [Planctomycetota bacterium]